MVAVAQYTLASCSRTRTASYGSTNAGRTGCIAWVSAGLLLQVTPVYSEPGRKGEDEHAGDVVIHPILIDGGECLFQVLGRIRSSPAIHRQQCELGLAVDERIGIAHRAPCDDSRIATRFADVRTVMAEMGLALMGAASASGENRAIEAAQKAISSPLLEDISIQGARGVLINITGGPDLCLHEVNEAASMIAAQCCASAVCPVNTAM
jgi:hypothetical protein